MKPLQILILEDNFDDAQTITNLLSETYTITLVNTLKKANNKIAASKFDLAISDNGIDRKLYGMEFAKHIQNSAEPMPFLFLTSMQSKTVFDQAKLTKPFTYLLKPFNDLEIQYSIELAIEKFFQQENTLRINNTLISDNYLLVKKQQSICKLDFDAIEYAAVEENYCTIYTANNKYVVKKSLAKIKELLGDENFEQTHRKFLVNFNKIKEINLSENTIYLLSGTHVSVSERYKKQLATRFNIIN